MQQFNDQDLRGAMFRESDLRDVRMRGVLLNHADIDGVIDGLVVNGVEVAPLIEAELDRRHPEREGLRARTPEQFRSGWAALERMWAGTYERVDSMPAGTTDVSVDEEWSFTETLRHLIFVTDTWFGWTVLGRRGGCDPIGIGMVPRHLQPADLGIELSARPDYAEVRQVRTDRVRQVRDFLAGLHPDDLGRVCDPPPFDPDRRPTVRDCLRILMNEEWEHHRFAVRDLTAIDTAETDVADR